MAAWERFLWIHHGRFGVGSLKNERSGSSPSSCGSFQGWEFYPEPLLELPELHLEFPEPLLELPEPLLELPEPSGLRAVVVVNSTSCSVACGPGVKEERVCEVTPAGEHRNCSLLRSRCLRDWICGLQHLAIPEGKPVRLLCLSPDAASLEGPNFGYTWRFSRGLITTNDLLFRPFRNPSPSLSFSPALESHSGTYRCDVQVLSSFQLVKRIYFGLRVIPRDLVDLDFEKSLTWEQQLVANGKEPPGNASGAAGHLGLGIQGFRVGFSGSSAVGF
uniref:Transmembrane protein 81 n=1 Tax=Cyanoderma ruficeps TaxID=181631 RepID=A0A8C3RAI8_9PASS